VDSEENQLQFEEEYNKARRVDPGACGDGSLGEVSSLTPVSCTRAQVLSYVSTQRDFLSGKPNKD